MCVTKVFIVRAANREGGEEKKMAPKKEKKEKGGKKKADAVKEVCGCGVSTFRAPPKGKKKSSAVTEHKSGCSYQRATCNRYPHLPRCAACEETCACCAGINPWCPYCALVKCKFMFKRDVLGWPKKDDTVSRIATAEATASEGAHMVAAAPAK